MRKAAGRTASGRVRGETRRRTLESARMLFNGRGVARVTTRLIAETAGINEGNLYYHFRTKASLVVALFAAFEEEAAGLAAPDGAERHELAPHVEVLRRWFVLTWRYRFLFQDMAAVQAEAPSLRPRLVRLSARLQAETRRSVADLAEAGLIAIPPGFEEPLLANVWIVSSSWIGFLVLNERVRAVRETHLRWGYNQVLSLYLPYLTEPALVALAALPEPSFSGEA
ncbi:TetR/AcrR family transcriptional regulator [Enterovirga rhinocerotis]|uniref:TetR family transcriptional regulator n=1 Tax=Enterovirga rhinocerotis TaxID=1339210 RepID=A0A4R7C9V3_9HYPH|nr:TetR/AcrR family transcriptional regulator [Enterovirga rhinocerotis]TDR93726.1 TetR family transcriptional regulator [Enterovirga rhinocerotis]